MTAAIPLLVSAVASEIAATEGGDSAPSGTVQVSDTTSMKFHAEGFRALMHHPETIKAITERAQRVADICNNTAVRKSARYEVIVQNWPSSTRARAFCRPANAAAFYDDRAFSTMLKAAAQVPSDPYGPATVEY